ncbi:hypothetical protein CIRG_09971 [Coccidioides immitis RMSCC 2394]|uniref:Amidase domain-containing protein n=1 Tax=Coccidioides immitis RMSCC 2394 TaxID=404692 RepID=A0A0J6Y655_COCIT|nr:hypothetical protein CIRG_09971 [Coccidioides immitis RMSCC 2394]
MTQTNISPWQNIVARKREARNKALKPFLTDNLNHRGEWVVSVAERSQTGSEKTQIITDISSIEVLHQQLEKGVFTAEDVVLAYIKRFGCSVDYIAFTDAVTLTGVFIGQQLPIKWLTNAITEVLFEDALKQAQELDKTFAETGRLQGPLHGIPISLKDQFNVKGHDTTLGYVGRSFAPAKEDAVLVQILKDMGAVPFVKTNLPQSIMWCETENPLFGLTLHPMDPELTPGGSTGGEAALLALHGSVLGFGTDIGGSIRIPQNMVGLYGFKPSSSRLPYYGVPVSTEGQEHIPSAVGPMARDLSTIIHISRLLAQSQPWKLDPRCAPLPWRDDMFLELQSRPMVIGLIVDDGVVRVHPHIRRHLLRLADKLRALGHEIVEWDTEGHDECIAIMDAYYTVDGGEDIKRDVAIAGEPYVPHVEALINRGKPISVYDYWQLNRKKFAAQKRYLDKWKKTTSPSGKPVDILLAPTMPHTAVPHRCCRWVGYTKVWNFLDYPALTFPVGKVEVDLDILPSKLYKPRNDLDAWNWALYDPIKMVGYPVNLQIIGQKLEEEKVLGAAVVINKVLR